jgi:hypothetical protein
VREGTIDYYLIVTSWRPSHLCSFRAADTNTVTQPHEVAPKIPPTMVSRNRLEPDDFSSHTPFPINYIDPMCSHTEERRLSRVRGPPVAGTRDPAGCPLNIVSLLLYNFSLVVTNQNVLF